MEIKLPEKIYPIYNISKGIKYRPKRWIFARPFRALAPIYFSTLQYSVDVTYLIDVTESEAAVRRCSSK